MQLLVAPSMASPQWVVTQDKTFRKWCVDTCIFGGRESRGYYSLIPPLRARPRAPALLHPTRGGGFGRCFLIERADSSLLRLNSKLAARQIKPVESLKKDLSDGVRLPFEASRKDFWVGKLTFRSPRLC